MAATWELGQRAAPVDGVVLHDLAVQAVRLELVEARAVPAVLHGTFVVIPEVLEIVELLDEVVEV